VTRILAAGEPLVRWDWVGRHLDEIWSKVVQHVELTVIAVAVGLVISMPVAIYAQRHRKVYAPVTFVAGLLYTIPSLALFVLLLPFTGLTTLTAEI
jgi:osmoprotectant transport system permease protein